MSYHAYFNSCNLHANIFKIFLQFLSRCVVGSSLEEPEEEDDAKSTDSFIPPPKEGCYEIVGTTKERGPNVEKPDYVKELVNVSLIHIL